MSLYLLDTDHISLYQMGHPRVLRQIMGHLQDRLAVTVITIEEQLSGWQRALRQARDDSRRAEVYRRMALTVENLSGWLILPFPLSAMTRHAGLLRQRLNVSSNDLKIAAIALETGARVGDAEPARFWPCTRISVRGLVGLSCLDNKVVGGTKDSSQKKLESRRVHLLRYGFSRCYHPCPPPGRILLCRVRSPLDLHRPKSCATSPTEKKNGTS